MKQIYKEHIPWINLLPLNLKSRRVTSKLRRILTKTSAFQQQVYSSLSSNQRYENEHSLKKDLEIEVEALRKTLDDLTIITTDLEQEVEGMRKELILMKKRHEKVGRPRSHQHSSDLHIFGDSITIEETTMSMPVLLSFSLNNHKEPYTHLIFPNPKLSTQMSDTIAKIQS